MHAAEFAATAGGIAALLTSITVIISGIRFFYRRGKADQELISALKAITDANAALSESFRRYTAKTDKTLQSMDHRITRLEPYQPNGTGNFRHSR